MKIITNYILIGVNFLLLLLIKVDTYYLAALLTGKRSFLDLTRLDHWYIKSIDWFTLLPLFIIIVAIGVIFFRKSIWWSLIWLIISFIMIGVYIDLIYHGVYVW